MQTTDLYLWQCNAFSRVVLQPRLRIKSKKAATRDLPSCETTGKRKKNEEDADVQFLISLFFWVELPFLKFCQFVRSVTEEAAKS